MLSIKDFCSYVGISRALYYVLRNQGDGPRETHVRSRRFVSKENLAEWLKAREVPTGVKAA